MTPHLDSKRAPGVGQPLPLEEQFRLMVESVRDYAIFLLDTSGRVSSWNSGARAIKGYAPEEIIGKHLSIFYTPEALARHQPQRLLEAAATEGRVEDEDWRVRKDGSRFWADVVITAMRNPAGDLLGFAKVTRDLTSRRESEEQLRRSEERLAATLSSIGDGLLATDEQARVTLINPIAQGLTGWSEREALGRPLEEVFHIIHEKTRARVQSPANRILEKGLKIGLASHTVLISRDGTERPIADSGAPIRDQQGGTRGAVLVFRDITEERRTEESLRQSEERLRLMIASVRDYALYLMDTEGRVVSWNPGAEQIKGYSEQEILGTHFSRFFPPEDVAEGKPWRELETAARLGRFEDEAWRVRKGGERFWANVIISAVHDASGHLVGFTKVTRDLTERRRTEEERLRLMQAQEAVRLRDEFLSIASHELKTPLTALQLQLQGVRDGVQSLDGRLAKRLEKATRAGERLADLIETLFDVSRIATGKLTLNTEPFDLVEAAHEVIERVRDGAAKAGCELSLRTEGPVRGEWDRLRVEQVLMNLVINAFKYAAGTPIEISLLERDGEARLEVRDHGPGIPEDDLSRIFGRFERATESSSGGMGLGLYIARQIGDAHGGSVSARNVEGGGACFTVRLPLTGPSRSLCPSGS